MPDASGTSDCFLFFIQSAVLRQDGRCCMLRYFWHDGLGMCMCCWQRGRTWRPAPLAFESAHSVNGEAAVFQWLRPRKSIVTFLLADDILGCPPLAITQGHYFVGRGLPLTLLPTVPVRGNIPNFIYSIFFWPECCDSKKWWIFWWTWMSPFYFVVEKWDTWVRVLHTNSCRNLINEKALGRHFLN